MCCSNFERVCKLNHEGRKTLCLDQLVVWEWSVVLTTKDLQIIKEANDGPWLRKLAVSHYIRDSIHVWMSSMWLGNPFGRHESSRLQTDLYRNKTWMFTSIESLTCRKGICDKVQRVDYEKILIFRSDTFVFTDSSRKSYIFWYGSWITKQLSSQGRLIKDVYVTQSMSFVKFKRVSRKVCKLQRLKWA